MCVFIYLYLFVLLKYRICRLFPPVSMFLHKKLNSKLSDNVLLKNLKARAKSFQIVNAILPNAIKYKIHFIVHITLVYNLQKVHSRRTSVIIRGDKEIARRTINYTIMERKIFIAFLALQLSVRALKCLFYNEWGSWTPIFL